MFFNKFRKNGTDAADETATEGGAAAPSANAADSKDGQALSGDGEADGSVKSSGGKGNEDSAAAAESDAVNTESTVPPNPEDGGMKITVEDEPEIDPERTELEGEVRKRDAAISALEKARLEKQNQLAKIESELEKEQLSQMKEALVHKIESERIKRQSAHAEDRLKVLETDMQDKAAIHEYANLIKGVAPKSNVDAQYVSKLQSQLQKAVQKMEATTSQMKELEDQSAETVDALTAEISELVEERCRTELELRKQLDVLESKKKEMRVEYEDRIRENLKTLQALKQKAASQTTIEELEEELQETETKVEELHRVQGKQEQTIQQLTTALAAQEAI